MARGGKRDNSGRRSNWQSSSETKAIRVPEWMIDDLMKVARQLDEGQLIGSQSNKNIYKDIHKEKLDNIKIILQKWEAKITKDNCNAPRWKNVATMVNELGEEIRKDSN
jgi:hypothetical protein